ncbi:hypothetical protein [Actinotalea sp. K2]|uniref:hypothetical protein n=1 Tax=Actinotalea sp. K2 TaxID=2939438 RepID=UPI002017CBF8|nr:hypothetical protein [Actinotalea sp. K2]MCL3861258.1 hypothetical protein [Actinotalea sp. K2]
MAIAIAGLWIVYLVPHRLRHRQQLLESRSEDRFSQGLRVLRVTHAGHAGRGHRAASRSPVPVATGTAGTGPTRVLLHPAVPRRGGAGVMDRPHRTADRVSADAARRAASEHATRAAHVARRAAAARRRALLTALLLTATVAGWAGVAFLSSAVVLGAAPSVLLLGTLGLGRRAVISGARADDAWAARPTTPDQSSAVILTRAVGASRPAGRVPVRTAPPRRSSGAVGRAVRPSDASTEVMARVPAAPVRVPAAARTDVRREVDLDRAEASLARDAEVREGARQAADQHPAPSSGDGSRSEVSSAVEPGLWAPVPVPRPSYTLKGAAPRREPAPLVLDAPAVSEASATAAVDGPVQDDAPADALPAGGADPAVPPAAGPPDGTTARHPGSPTPVAPGLDLDTILARRRASGE